MKFVWPFRFLVGVLVSTMTYLWSVGGSPVEHFLGRGIEGRILSLRSDSGQTLIALRTADGDRFGSIPGDDAPKIEIDQCIRARLYPILNPLECAGGTSTGGDENLCLAVNQRIEHPEIHPCSLK